MKTILTSLAAVFLVLLIVGNPKAASTGPTMLVITNDIQWSLSMDGPWTTIASNYIVVWVLPTNAGYYRAKLHSSGFIP